ncbi:MAG: DUF4328 domain-containing protein, partial [Pseudomonadota bacterium]
EMADHRGLLGKDRREPEQSPRWVSISFLGVDRAATPLFWASFAMLCEPIGMAMLSYQEALYAGLIDGPNMALSYPLDELVYGYGVVGIGVPIAFFLPTFFATFFLYRWFWLAAHASLTHTANPPQISAWGIVIWNFVPIALLFKPFQNLRAIWRSTGKMPERSTVFALFWTSSVISSIVGSIYWRQGEDFVTSPGWLIFDAFALAFSLLFWGSTRIVVRQITDALQDVEQRSVF